MTISCICYFQSIGLIVQFVNFTPGVIFSSYIWHPDCSMHILSCSFLSKSLQHNCTLQCNDCTLWCASCALQSGQCTFSTAFNHDSLIFQPRVHLSWMADIEFSIFLVFFPEREAETLCMCSTSNVSIFHIRNIYIYVKTVTFMY